MLLQISKQLLRQFLRVYIGILTVFERNLKPFFDQEALKSLISSYVRSNSTEATLELIRLFLAL